jgi:hypothetical protein
MSEKIEHGEVERRRHARERVDELGGVVHLQHQVLHPRQAPAEHEGPAHQPEERALAPETLSGQIEEEKVLAPRLGRAVAHQLRRAGDRVPHGHREPVGAPLVDHAPVVPDPVFAHVLRVVDLEGREAVHAKGLVDQEEHVDELEPLPLVHLLEGLRLRQALLEVPADPDDGRLVDAVDVERNAIGLSNAQRRENSLPAVHVLLPCPTRSTGRRSSM